MSNNDLINLQNEIVATFIVSTMTPSTTGDNAIASLPDSLTAENCAIIGYSLQGGSLWYSNPQDFAMYISDTLVRINTTNGAYLNKAIKVIFAKFSN